MSQKQAGAAPLGQVLELWRYPVKSMLGEQVSVTTVSERGLEGDRTYALLDLETGRVASAKKPVLWRDLLTFSAALGRDDRSLRVTFPDGRAVSGDSAAMDAELSVLLGREVSLKSVPPADAEIERARPDEVLAGGVAVETTIDVGRLGRAAPAGTFFDFAPVHILTTASLAAVEALGAPGIELRRYRPNIVLEVEDVADFVEDRWVGRRLRVGEVLMEVIIQTPRCAVPTLAHGELPQRPEAMVRLMEGHRIPVEGVGVLPCLGVYARVLQPGTVRQGDTASFE